MTLAIIFQISKNILTFDVEMDVGQTKLSPKPIDGPTRPMH